jgi:hypothetical protein
MVQWPVPESYSQRIPFPPSPGSFWENRDDRHHCGVDIYAPCGSVVVAVESGEVEYIAPSLCRNGFPTGMLPLPLCAASHRDSLSGTPNLARYG